MVAFSLPEQNDRLQPMDTGAIFNGNVRVWLFTDDMMEAAACGRKLHELGLPLELRLIQRPSVQGMFALNPEAPPRPGPGGRTMPQLLRYRNYPMILETEDTMDLMRFFKWLHQKNPNVPKPKGPPNLKDLAEAGEIETIDAG